MKYFANLKTLKDIKDRYHDLVRKNHPDVGGDTATMQEINKQYAEAVKWIAKHGEQRDAETASAEVPEEYMAAVSAAVACEGLDVELVGSWIWVTGNTMPHKNTLKAAGYYWASKKKAWYWRPAEAAVKNKSKMTLDEIRTKYGTQTLSGSVKPRIAIAG